MGEWSVYKHTTPDGKVYIGATSRLPRVRWNYGHGYRNTPFFDAIVQIGWNNIQHEIVATHLSESEAYELEKRLIQEYDSTNPDRGFNRASGGYGSSGVKISEETRQRLVSSHLGKKNPHTQEWNRKISESNRGKRKPHIGIPRSEECRAKIGDAHSVSVVSFHTRYKQIQEYPSIKVASQETGVSATNISRCCRGLRKTAGGYIWKINENLGGNKHD